MPYFAGLRGTGSFGADERPKNFREMILWMNPNGSAPLFALSSKAKTEAVDDPEFSWWEEINTICRLTINMAGNAAAGVTTLVVDDGALQLIPGDILQVEGTEVAAYTNELLRVVSVTNDTTLVVQRGVANTTAATINDNTALTRIGNAQSEGNRSIASSSTNPTKLSNYCQIFKTPYQITKSALAIRTRTGDPKKNEQKRKSFQHAEKLEQALLWGKPYETTDASNGNLPLRFTGGLRNFITSNRKVYSANPTVDSFLNDITPIFDYESGSAGNERMVFMGNGALNYMNKLVRSETNARINYEGTTTFYGMNLQKWTIPQGTLYLKSHPLMNVHPVYTYSMFVVNPSGLIYRPLKGRDTKVEKDIQENDADYIKDQWLTEAGFEFHFERTHAYIGGFKQWT
jgi:Family of unknown function (DUF5309)